VLAAVVFDMDGVLIDSEPMHFATTCQVLARRGARLEPGDYERCTGMAELAFFELLVERFGLAEPPAVLARERTALSLERLAVDPLPPAPGALECLLGLSAAGYALALASSATRAQVELVVDRLGVRALFGALVSVDDVARGKPAPDLFLEAARRLGVPPAECLVVEDAALGVRAATAAGMDAVALVPEGRSADEHLAAGASLRITTLAELQPERLEVWGT